MLQLRGVAHRHLLLVAEELVALLRKVLAVFEHWHTEVVALYAQHGALLPEQLPLR
eukprot:CAMPEP_0179864576 /NCGR_PEP_ID=MMETSP0982-20121206/16259_1 /TAXON_ID=483367 /ORGANISM="non described non described, Strain CCMP 2436" /LENGTH=55 /DNA_ID=CAMNT_0021752975 /DNA_START=45 /DNA_END=208 /DNA_ORIENTATION=-